MVDQAVLDRLALESAIELILGEETLIIADVVTTGAGSPGAFFLAWAARLCGRRGFACS